MPEGRDTSGWDGLHRFGVTGSGEAVFRALTEQAPMSSLGCAAAQGHHFARPARAAAVSALLAAAASGDERRGVAA
jgi:predicted signal transduction protein with EAL and GGDEF domain